MATKSISRRTFLLGMGASGLLAACGGGSGSGSGSPSASASPAGPASSSVPQAGGDQSMAKTPLTLDLTQTDLPAGTAVYAYVIGETSLASGVTQYWIDSTGTPTDR